MVFFQLASRMLKIFGGTSLEDSCLLIMCKRQDSDEVGVGESFLVSMGN